MSQTKKNSALVWFKNNLRIQDNLILHEACKKHDTVVAVFYFEKSLFSTTQFGFKKIEKYRAKFLIESVQDLRRQLANLNITLLVYFEHPETHIIKVCNEFSINNLYFQKEWTNEEVSQINTIKKRLPDHITTYSDYDQFLIHPNDINLKFSEIANTFTNFRKYVEKYYNVRQAKTPSTKSIDNLLTKSTSIPKLKELGFSDFEMHANTAFPFVGGEKNAIERLEYYFFTSKKLGFYKKTRNGLVGKDYSSKLSAWLANGSISPRIIFHKVKEFEEKHFKNQSTYWLIFELLWRDYFKYVSLKYRDKIFSHKGILNKHYEWNSDQYIIEQWINGTTAEPFVNANMLELMHTGWMSNRGRQNVASYFAKNLRLDWRIGAAYFESLLIDYDVHSNYGNWMYVAGVGNDTRDRTFNVRKQAEMYDSDGTFQNIWLQPKLFKAL